MKRAEFYACSGRISLLFLLVLAPPLYGENVRGEVTAILSSGGGSGLFRPEQLIAVDFSSVNPSQNGIELRIDIPEGLRRYPNTFALLLFRDVSPAPDDTVLSYSGDRMYMRLIPARDSMYVRIPFSPDHRITGDAYTDILPHPVTPNEYPLIAAVLPVMKGVPDSAYSHSMELEVVPLWKNEGRITVEIANPSGDADEEFQITVDDRPVALGETITLEAGLHKVRVSSTHAAPVERTAALKPGDELLLSVEMDYSPPELTVRFPLGAAVLLDGEIIEAEGTTAILDISPGEHEIIGIVGDVQVSRRFTVSPGGKIQVELIVDIDIVELGDESGQSFGSGDG